MKRDVFFSSFTLRMALYPFLCLFFFITPSLSSALEPIVLKKGWESITPSLSMDILEDESNSLTIEELLAEKREEDFFQSKSKFPAFGASKSTFWGRFTIKNPLDIPQEWFLEAWHLMQYADLYIIENGEVTYKRTEGRIFPYSHREVDFHNTTFKGEIPPQSEYTVYIKFKSVAPIFSFTLWSHDAFHEMIQSEIAINGFLIGIMVVMLLYNLFIFFSLKDSRYLYYVFFILSGLLSTLTLNQIGFQLFWPNSPQWELITPTIFLPAQGVFAIFFAQTFLETKKRFPTIHRLLSIVAIGFALSLTIGLFDQFLGLSILFIFPIPFLILMMLAGIKCYMADFRPAGYYLLAWSIFFATIFIRALGIQDIIPINQFTFIYGRQIAYAIDAIILSMALTDMINDLKGEKEKANFEKQEAQRLYSEELEHKVEERTEELHNALEELHLRQEQLVLVEKQASLGQLVAGVAHEINTPVSICITAASHFQDLNKEIKRNMESNTLKKTLLESFLNDSWRISEMILKSLHRTGDLVRSFKMVAADQRNEDKRSFFLKEYMESLVRCHTTSLNRRPLEVKVSCLEDFEINSFPSSIALVVNNLIINSLTHAFQEEEKGTINIDIELLKGKEVVITYSDSGKGIPKKNLKKIFEPFFTTNRSGGGTGLGLHIIFNIVTQDLKGYISCNSTEGEGTTFTITIPREI